jgi:hypothetical protein
MTRAHVGLRGNEVVDLGVLEHWERGLCADIAVNNNLNMPRSFRGSYIHKKIYI